MYLRKCENGAIQYLVGFQVQLLENRSGKRGSVCANHKHTWETFVPFIRGELAASP